VNAERRTPNIECRTSKVSAMRAFIRTLTVVGSAALAAGRACAAPDGDGIFFDGRTYYEVPQAAVSLNPSNFSVACWVKTPSTNSQVFVNMGDAGTGFTLYRYHPATENSVRMLVEHDPSNPVASARYTSAKAPATPTNVWFHYAGTYDGVAIRLYTNGALCASTAAAVNRGVFPYALQLGAVPNFPDRMMRGAMEDIRIWNRALSSADVGEVYQQATEGAVANSLAAWWTGEHIGDASLVSAFADGPDALRRDQASLLLSNTKANGFRGIWYYNQPSGDEYVYKYSGGMATYCAKHIPFAWYAPETNRTFFCYGGTDENNSTLLHLVSYFDHTTGQVARPTLLLDKKTDDAHDNPVINLDDQGYIWIFSSSHGTARPSYISRSVRPYDIDQFQLVWSGNFSYPQPMYYPGHGFLFIHTWYVAGRGNYLMTSNPDGTVWTPRRELAYFEEGHYQISGAWGTNKTGIAFNMHPIGKGLNYRTNLYYMESDDFGETWKTAGGTVLDVPLSNKANPALVFEYESWPRNVYVKDTRFDSQGRPLVLFVLSKGYASGPANDPREWRIAQWTGSSWTNKFTGIVSDSNYDTGSLYVESDTRWTLIAPTVTGPQAYNPGGEIAMWLTEDAGLTWRRTRRMTRGSVYNHTYVRHPVHAHPDFYGFWADGHGRQESESRLYFCNKAGSVFRLPQTLTGDFATPERVPVPGGTVLLAD
jgi:hypothetical protein